MRINYKKASIIIVNLAFLSITVLLGLFVYAHSQQPSFKHAYLYPKSARTIPDFTLIQTDKSNFDKRHLEGKWSFLFFGYTHCPDVCPQTLQIMQSVQAKQLKHNTQFIFISIDPQRDKLEQLKNYVEYFSSDFIGLTGNQQQLQRINQIFDTSYNKIDNPENSDYYYMGHSAALYIITPTVERFALLPPPHNIDHIISDFKLMQTL